MINVMRKEMVLQISTSFLEHNILKSKYHLYKHPKFCV